MGELPMTEYRSYLCWESL